MEKSKVAPWVFMVGGVLLLASSLTAAGLFPSGHGVGRFPELVTGIVFLVYGFILLRPRSS